jgi:hypothetical protein
MDRGALDPLHSLKKKTYPMEGIEVQAPTAESFALKAPVRLSPHCFAVGLMKGSIFPLARPHF